MSKATILIVEDEAIVAADLAGTLERLGYEICGTTGLAEEAIRLARERRPDLVLMDIHLAGAMDGVEAAGVIHRELDLPVVFLTAHSDHATLERAKLSEPFGYLLKPFEEFGLETHIEMALYKHRSERKLRQAHDELELRVQERTRELKEAEQELRENNESLERRVAERTAELFAANVTLRGSRLAALNLIEDAVAARTEAEEASEGLRREITERKQAEAALLHSKEEWERTFNSVPDLIAIIDDRHRVMRVNKAMADRLGREPEECVGMPCYEAVHGANLPPDFCPHSRTICDGGEHNVELHEERLGGDYLVTTTPFLDREGRMTGTVHVARDITERKRTEEALRRAYDEMEKRVEERTAELRDKDQILLLQSRQAAMGEMIGNIAHQWRQPLNTLGLTIQRQLLLYDLGEFTRELLAKDVSSSMELIQHMSRTIDDFSNYFKPDKEKSEFKVHEAIVNTLSLLEGALQNSRISVEIAAKDDLVICGYQNEFAQVLLNIMINARDALLERKIDDPRVTITIRNEGGCAVLTVADNAGGIPEEIIDKVFDPYFTTKGPQHGTGVGLFMSKAIIEKNMGGRLAVRNSGNGAEFRIEVCTESGSNPMPT